MTPVLVMKPRSSTVVRKLETELVIFTFVILSPVGATKPKKVSSSLTPVPDSVKFEVTVPPPLNVATPVNVGVEPLFRSITVTPKCVRASPADPPVIGPTLN